MIKFELRAGAGLGTGARVGAGAGVGGAAEKSIIYYIYIFC